jgi:hypothetical protein
MLNPPCAELELDRRVPNAPLGKPGASGRLMFRAFNNADRPDSSIAVGVR